VFNVGSVQGYLKLNTTGWITGTGRAKASLASLSRTMMRFGAVTVGSMLLITREFGKFDKAIRHATSVSETTEAQFKQMSEMALDASVKWNKAATETAQAFYYLGSAGLSVTEQMQAFNDVVMLSRAMGSELSMTVEGLVDITKAFKLEFKDTNHIANQLAATVVSSNQNFHDLDRSLAYAGATAAATNNTLAETAAMLGIMANAGIKGSMAGTILRRSLANLLDPTAEMNEIIHKLGISMYDTAGEQYRYIDVMKQLENALAGMSNQYKNYVFKVLFGLRAVGGQIALFNAGSEAVEKFAKKIYESTAAQDVADKQMKAFSEQMGRLWQQIRRVAITLGELLAPSIKVVADRIRDSFKAFDEYIKSNKEAIASTLKWTLALGAVMAIGIPLLSLIVSLGLQMAAIAGILLNPWVALVTALYVVRAVWKGTFSKGGELNKALDEFTEVLKDWLINSFGVFGKAMVWIGQKTVEGWTEIFDLFSKIGKPELPSVPGAPGFGDVVEKAGTLIGEIAKTVKSQFKQDVQDLSGIVIQYLPPSMKEAYASLRELLNLFLNPEQVQKVMDELPKAGKKAGEQINEDAIGYAKKYNKTWQKAVRGVIEEFSEQYNLLQDTFSDIQSSWASTIENFINEGGKFKDFMEDMFMGVLRAFNKMVAEMIARRLFFEIFGKMAYPSDMTPFGIRIPGAAYVPGIPTTSVIQRQSTLDWSKSQLGQDFSGSTQKPALGDVEINITNTSTPADLRITGRRFDGRRYVIDAVLEEYNTNPNFRGALRR